MHNFQSRGAAGAGEEERFSWMHRCSKQDKGQGSPSGDSFKLLDRCCKGDGDQGSPVGGGPPDWWAASLDTGGCRGRCWDGACLDAAIGIWIHMVMLLSPAATCRQVTMLSPHGCWSGTLLHLQGSTAGQSWLVHTSAAEQDKVVSRQQCGRVPLGGASQSRMQSHAASQAAASAVQRAKDQVAACAA